MTEETKVMRVADQQMHLAAVKQWIDQITDLASLPITRETLTNLVLKHDLNEVTLQDLIDIHRTHNAQFARMSNMLSAGYSTEQISDIYEIREGLSIGGQSVSIAAIARFARTFPDIDVDELGECIEETFQVVNRRYRRVRHIGHAVDIAISIAEEQQFMYLIQVHDFLDQHGIFDDPEGDEKGG